MTQKRDYNVYISEMKKSTRDKLFFLNKLDLDSFDVIIDYGCGEGIITKACLTNSEKPICWSIDIDNFMLKQINKAYENNKRVRTTKTLNSVKINSAEKVLLIFSSVLHEIKKKDYSEIVSFIKKYNPVIVIRDMYFENDKNTEIAKQDIEKISKFSDKQQINDFKKRWGLKTKLDLYHYLLKYSFVKNWALEIKENYFSTQWEIFLNKHLKYSILYDEKFILSFKKRQIKKDFKIDLDSPTHRRMIIKYNKN